MVDLVKALNKHVTTPNWNQEVASKLDKMVVAVRGRGFGLGWFGVGLGLGWVSDSTRVGGWWWVVGTEGSAGRIR